MDNPTWLPDLMRQVLTKYPPGLERNVILMFVNGRGYKSIAKHYGCFTVDQVKALTAPYMDLLMWQSRVKPGTTKEAIAAVLLDDELEQLKHLG